MTVDPYVIRDLMTSYLCMGSNAERAGQSRRASAYRSVANMLGVALQGGEPFAVDFLARYPEPEEDKLTTDAICFVCGGPPFTCPCHTKT